MPDPNQPHALPLGVMPAMQREEVPDPAADKPVDKLTSIRDRLRANAAPIPDTLPAGSVVPPGPADEKPRAAAPVPASVPDPSAKVEVELKFRIASVGEVGPSNPATEPNVYNAAKTLTTNFRKGDVVAEHDEYFTAPHMAPDTYLRIRTYRPDCDSWDTVELTWKGPLLSPDSKTRCEENCCFKHDSAAPMRRLLKGMGYTCFAEVKKTRQLFKLVHAGSEVTMSFDKVEGLGTFVELEILTIRAAAAGAEAVLLDLAKLIGLSEQERRGYATLAQLAAAKS